MVDYFFEAKWVEKVGRGTDFVAFPLLRYAFRHGVHGKEEKGGFQDVTLFYASDVFNESIHGTDFYFHFEYGVELLHNSDDFWGYAKFVEYLKQESVVHGVEGLEQVDEKQTKLEVFFSAEFQ